MDCWNIGSQCGKKNWSIWSTNSRSSCFFFSSSCISVRTVVTIGRRLMIVVVRLFLDGELLFYFVSLNFTFSSRANKVNALVIHQYSQYIKLFDITTGQLTSILNDVIQSKLFSRYLLAKQLHENVNDRNDFSTCFSSKDQTLIFVCFVSRLEFIESQSRE